MTPEELAAWQSRTEELRKQLGRGRILSPRQMWAIGCLWFALMAGMLPIIEGLGMGWLWVVLYCSAIVLVQWLFMQSYDRWVAATKLAHHRSLDAIGPLAEMLEMRSSAWREWAADTLVKFLPHVSRDDPIALTAAQRAILYQRLCGEDTALAEAIMGALGEVGAREAITPVERASAHYARLEDADMQAAAEKCLAALRRNIATGREELLRPADEPADSVLLRPAQGAAESDSSQLLRPANKE